MKWENVMVPSPTHVPGPTAALKVVGSHWSWIRIANGLRAAINAMEAAIGINVRVTAAVSSSFFMVKLLLFRRQIEPWWCGYYPCCKICQDEKICARWSTRAWRGQLGAQFDRAQEGVAGLLQGFFSAGGFAGGLGAAVAGRDFEGEAGWGVQKAGSPSVNSLGM